MDDGSLLEILHATADAVSDALAGLVDWGLAGTRAGQYRSDLLADQAALAVLDQAGLGVLSEESGRRGGERPILVVVDPVDGSTNASRHLPYFATSLCALDADGPRAAVVAGLAGPGAHRYQALRGGGASRDGQPIAPSGCRSLAQAIVGLNGWSPRHLGWRQYRALGSAALELCAVADGTLDGYVDLGRAGLGPWDYLGAWLVCLEAGAPLGEWLGRDLVVRAHDDRRSPVAAATPALLDELMAARRSLDGPGRPGTNPLGPGQGGESEEMG